MKKFILIPIMFMGCLNPKQIPNRVQKNPDKFVRTILIDVRWNGNDVNEPWRKAIHLDKMFYDNLGSKLTLTQDPYNPDLFWLESE